MSSGTAEPWLFLIGIGEDGVEGLSVAARTLISRAELVVGGRRHLALAASLIRGESLAWASPIEATFPHLLAWRGRPVCVLATGDPFHYGIGTALLREIPIAEIACIPHPSAFSLAAARLGWTLQDCACVSLHGRALERVVPHLNHGTRLLALSWDGSTPGLLADLLNERGFGGSRMTICEALGGPAESIRHSLAAPFDLPDIGDLNIVGVAVRASQDARQRPWAAGMPDDFFDHDGQITKSPIRAITLSALAPRPGDVLWDVGAGSGSVSIEWLLAHPATRAIAFEKHPDRVARIARNARHWGVADRLTVIAGPAPETLNKRQAPDAIFIGGGLSAPGLLQTCRGALRPHGRIVVNAVTIESQTLLGQAFGHDGGDLFTLSVAQAEPVGGFHGLRPSMPVMQWRWTKP